MPCYDGEVYQVGVVFSLSADPISFHPTFEEAEHRLQHITTPAVYYDKQGRRVMGQPPEQCELLGVLDEKPTSPDDSCPES